MFRTAARAPYLACLCAPYLLSLSVDSAACAQPRPNIVLILADDLGYGDLGCYGSQSISTPHLDRLAAKGLRFTDFHASGPVCSPTRAGLMTGRYQQRAGIGGVINADPKKNRHHGLFPQEITCAELLESAGYATAVFGKWHLGYETKFNPVHHGFDRFRGYVSGNVDYFSHFDRIGFADWWENDRLAPEEGYTTHLITRHAVEFISRNKQRPFFAYLAHEAVHSPFQGPDDEPVRSAEGSIGNDRDNLPDAYREMIEEMDRGVGEVLAALERHDLTERTLVVFFSDNGAAKVGSIASNGALHGHKGSLWEGGHRVPAIASWPGRIEAGRVCRETAISLDLMPTFLSVAGVSVPSGHKLDGRDLSGLLFHNEALPSRMLFWQFGRQSAVRQGPWKLIQDGVGKPGVGLFDLDADLGETLDTAAQHPEQVRVLHAALEAWQREIVKGATEQP